MTTLLLSALLAADLVELRLAPTNQVVLEVQDVHGTNTLTLVLPPGAVTIKVRTLDTPAPLVQASRVPAVQAMPPLPSYLVKVAPLPPPLPEVFPNSYQEMRRQQAQQQAYIQRKRETTR